MYLGVWHNCGGSRAKLLFGSRDICQWKGWQKAVKCVFHVTSRPNFSRVGYALSVGNCVIWQQHV